MITSRQKAWMAGVIETRGKIRFTNDPMRKTNQLVLQVRTSTIPIVHRMCELTGVAYNHQNVKSIVVADRRPCIEHCTEAHSHVEAEIPEHAIWSISGAGAAIVLDNLVTSMMVNFVTCQVMANNILSDLPKGGRGRFAVDQTIIRLKKLGWKIPQLAMDGFIGTPVARGHKGQFVKTAVPV